MKRYFIYMCLTLMIACFASCSDDVMTEASRTNLLSNESMANDASIMRFRSREALLDAIKNGVTPGTRASDEVSVPADFVSLMDEIEPTAEFLDSLSEEERDTILQNHMTYYEVFDMEDLVPNEQLAALLNLEGEIIMGDSIYKITEYGTLCADLFHLNLLRSIAVNLHTMNVTYNHGADKTDLSAGVSIIDTYHRDTTTYVNPFKPEQPGQPEQPDQPIGEDPGTSESLTYKPWTSVNFNYFPTFYAYSHTFIGKLIDDLFGERHTRHYTFKNDYRVNGSLYSYNYGFYHETGTYVSMQKKRGGFFRPINGWKEQKANELFIHVDSVIMEMKVNLPSPVFTSSMPTNMKVVGTTDFGTSSKQVSILGFYMSEQEIYNVMGKGLKEAIKQIKNLTSSSVPDNTRSILIVTQQKVYRFIYDETYYVSDTDKLRKVYDSGAFFFVSSNYFYSQWYKSIGDYIKEALKNPRFDLKRGQVKVAGRHGNTWGGMTIKK